MSANTQAVKVVADPKAIAARRGSAKIVQNLKPKDENSATKLRTDHGLDPIRKMRSNQY